MTNGEPVPGVGDPVPQQRKIDRCIIPVANRLVRTSVEVPTDLLGQHFDENFLVFNAGHSLTLYEGHPRLVSPKEVYEITDTFAPNSVAKRRVVAFNIKELVQKPVFRRERPARQLVVHALANELTQINLRGVIELLQSAKTPQEVADHQKMVTRYAEMVRAESSAARNFLNECQANAIPLEQFGDYAYLVQTLEDQERLLAGLHQP